MHYYVYMINIHYIPNKHTRNINKGLHGSDFI